MNRALFGSVILIHSLDMLILSFLGLESKAILMAMAFITLIHIAALFLGVYFWKKTRQNVIYSSQKTLNPMVIWFTGLSGAGKTTIANEVCRRLQAQKISHEHLDGDAIRSSFPRTGFSREDRENHIRRVGYLASRLEKFGVLVVASLISPYQESRDFVKSLCQNYIEVYVCTSLEICESRDPKGLYRRARLGSIKQFTGIDDPYEVPKEPDVLIDTAVHSAHESAEIIMKTIASKQKLNIGESSVIESVGT